MVLKLWFSVAVRIGNKTKTKQNICFVVFFYLFMESVYSDKVITDFCWAPKLALLKRRSEKLEEAINFRTALYKPQRVEMKWGGGGGGVGL